jgi:hypothetical protein
MRRRMFSAIKDQKIFVTEKRVTKKETKRFKSIFMLREKSLNHAGHDCLKNLVSFSNGYWYIKLIILKLKHLSYLRTT